MMGGTRARREDEDSLLNVEMLMHKSVERRPPLSTAMLADTVLWRRDVGEGDGGETVAAGEF